MSGLTDAEREILLHLTGLDRSGDVTRNHFAAEPGGDDHATLAGLESRGLVRGRAMNPALFRGLVGFRATDAGIAAARAARDPAETTTTGGNTR